MSNKNVSKFKALFKGKAEAFAGKAGQAMGTVAFEVKKGLDAVTPVARSTLAEIGQTLNAVNTNFQQALLKAETKAREKADQEARLKAHATAAAAGRETPPPASGSGPA